MTETPATPPPAKRAAAPKTVTVPEEVLTDLRATLAAIRNDLALLHNKVDAFKARADEAEKLLSHPAVKAATKVRQAWKGLG